MKEKDWINWRLERMMGMIKDLQREVMDLKKDLKSH